MWVGLRKIGRLAVFAPLALAASSLPVFAGGPPVPASTVADKVLVLKGERKLLLLKGDQVLIHYQRFKQGIPEREAV